MWQCPRMMAFSTIPPERPDENCDILYGMKAMFTAVFLVSIAVVAPAQGPQPGVAAGEAPFYAGVSDAASLRAAVEQRTARAERHLKALLEVQGARTIDNTLVPYDRMGMEYASALGLTRIVSRLHPDEQMRTAAEELGQSLATTNAALALRPDIYSALRAIDISNADPATRRYVTRELRDLFQEAGVPPWKRGRLPLVFDAEGTLVAVADIWLSESGTALLAPLGARVEWTSAEGGPHRGGDRLAIDLADALS